MRRPHAPRSRQPLIEPGRSEVAISVWLGRDDLDAVERAVYEASTVSRVSLRIAGFDYFDQDCLERLTQLVERRPGQVTVEGLDRYAETVTGPPSSVDVRTDVERAVTHLAAVTVIVAQELQPQDLPAALHEAVAAGRQIVTVDARCVSTLSPSVVVAFLDAEAELRVSGRSLLVVNASSDLAGQLRREAPTLPLAMSLHDLV